MPSVLDAPTGAHQSYLAFRIVRNFPGGGMFRAIFAMRTFRADKTHSAQPATHSERQQPDSVATQHSQPSSDMNIEADICIFLSLHWRRGRAQTISHVPTEYGVCMCVYSDADAGAS